MAYALASAVGLLLFNANVSLAIVNLVTLTVVPALVKVAIPFSIGPTGRALPAKRTDRRGYGQQPDCRRLAEETAFRKKRLSGQAHQSWGDEQ